MDDQSLTDFVETVCGESRLRVEADLGDGFVRLRSSEAERRQAAQDIRSSEDILIELLRNGRDAGARHLFVATQKSDSHRLITVVDDGSGIPSSQHHRIFEPRVTSKLDSAHMDKWGMHGRGMALYSIAVNALAANVRLSTPGRGTSIFVETDTASLSEKADQSTFPRFERGESGALAMRGPKNLVRTAAEFALEHRGQCAVYFGSATEIAATLHSFGMATLSPALRAFCRDEEEIPLVKSLALAADPEDLARRCEDMGLDLSPRSARRILDGALSPICSLMDRLERESFPGASKPQVRKSPPADRRGLKLAADDEALIGDALAAAVEQLAPRYFLEAVGRPEVSATGEAIRVTIPISKLS